MPTRNILERKDYNTHYNYKRYLAEDFKNNFYQCQVCGVGTDIKGYLYKCCLCGKFFCEECMIDVEFESNQKISKDPQDEYIFANCEPFIEIGKWCRECFFSNALMMNVWNALKKERIVVSTLSTEEVEEDDTEEDTNEN